MTLQKDLKDEIHPSNYQFFFQINDLIIYLKGLDGKATDLLEPVRFTTANIIASILVSETYKWGDPEQLQVPVTLAYMSKVKRIVYQVTNVFFPSVGQFINLSTSSIMSYSYL